MDVLHKMKEMILRQSTKYFSQFNEFPHLITSITMNELSHRTKRLDSYGAPLDLRLALLIARTHAFLGNSVESTKYTHLGLKNIGSATGLIQDFKEFID